MTKHFVTLSDSNYLVYGLTLYESIKKNIGSDFKLYYLALDDFTYNKLEELDNPDIEVYSINDIENDDMFDTLKDNNESRPIDTSDGQSPFHWALASFFTFFIMRTKQPSHCLYIDSDIIFYQDPQMLFDSVENHSIGIITHKHMKLNKWAKDVGYYNVGVIYFRNDEVGYKCLKWWSGVVADKNNPWFEHFGTCGDQKYLECFEDLFGENNIKILCRDVGNGAPWNFHKFQEKDKFFRRGQIHWLDEERIVLIDTDSVVQDLVFNHFSHFTPDFDNDTYTVDRDGEWSNICKIDEPGIKDIYDDYFESIKITKRNYGL